MKSILLKCLVIICIYSGCSNPSNFYYSAELPILVGDIIVKGSNSKFDSIVVSYLDWNLRTRGSLDPDDVRNFNNGKNEVFIIKKRKVIDSIIESLSLSNLVFISKKQSADYRMIMDFYKKGERLNELCLFSRYGGFIHHGNWFKSRALYRIIESEIPKITAPFKSFNY